MDTQPALLQGLQCPAQALVTGASRGIGLALATALLQRSDVACVHAVARHAEVAPGLAALATRHGTRLQRHAIDITDDDHLATLAGRVRGHGAALHLVINAAGVLHDDGLRPEKSLAAVTRAALERSFALNAFSPILLAQALHPLLPRAQPATFASLSARVGSIGDNRSGGWYAYRAAKAAQNQLLHTWAIELRRTHPRATCLLLHPGTVDTALSAPFQAGLPPGRLFAPDAAAAALLAVIAARTPADSGGFFAWDGTPIAW
ncbi:MAG TPA: SDR family NAD(P)-dependent oxidoreductase [Luteimonas sp.]|nr:SDR family NAD(P)-dependent oxidoreductase [Luteimonas sp.]